MNVQSPTIMSLKVPSIAGVIRSCDLALEDLAAHPRERQAQGARRAGTRRCRGPRRARRPPRRARRRPARRNRVRLPLRRRAAAVLDRLQRRRRPPRRLLLRHPRVGSAARQLHGDRARQGVARALVQARTLADAERLVAGAALVERVDVRVPDAAAGHAIARRHAARRDLRGGRAPADALRRAAAACRGASPSRPTTSRTSKGTISTGPSACPASASSAAWPTTWWSRRTRRCSPRRSRRARSSRTSSGCALQGLSGRLGFYEAIDYTPERLPADVKGGVVLAHLHGAPPGHEPARARQPAATAARCSAASTPIRASQAAELLLQERIPRLVPLKNPPIEQAEHVPVTRGAIAPPVRRYVTPHTLSPRGAPALERLLLASW